MIYKNFYELNKAYNKERSQMSFEEELSYIEDCFDTHEALGFRDTFESSYAEGDYYNGMKFTVDGRCQYVDGDIEDLSSLPRWHITLEDGTKIDAYPKDICLAKNLQKIAVSSVLNHKKTTICDLPIKRNLNEDTRKQGVLVAGEDSHLNINGTDYSEGNTDLRMMYDIFESIEIEELDEKHRKFFKEKGCPASYSLTINDCYAEDAIILSALDEDEEKGFYDVFEDSDSLSMLLVVDGDQMDIFCYQDGMFFEAEENRDTEDIYKMIRYKLVNLNE